MCLMTVLENSWTLPGAGRSVTADHQFSQPLPGCSPLQWIHDQEGCWWGWSQALAARGLLQCSRSGGRVGGLYHVQGVTSRLGWQHSRAEWKPLAGLCGLLGPRLKVETREEGRVPWPVPITRSPGPGWTDGNPSHPRALGPAGQKGAPRTREPWARLDGRAPLAPECPRSLLSAQALHGDTRLCVLHGCVCCTRTSQRVWTFTLLSCSVMSCCLGGHGWRAAAYQTGRVRPLPSFPPRLSAQTRRHPPCPLLVWRCARSVRGVSRVPPALPLLGAGCGEPPNSTSPVPSGSV